MTGVDIQLSNAARNQWPLAIECKKHARFAIYDHYDQATENARLNEIPIVVIEANRREPLVVVDARVFFNLYKDARNGQQP